MTLNQVINRLEALALSHKQINHFFFGEIVDWLANGDLRYPCCFVEINKSTISKEDKQIKYNFDVWHLDLVNVDVLTDNNQVDVMSDLTSVAGDYLAMLNFSDYQDDFTIETNYDLEYFREKFEDLTIAVRTNVTIGIDYLSDRCAVPASGVIFEPGLPYDPSIQIVDNIVYNYIYNGKGTEGNNITINALINKTILMLYKGDKLMVPITSSPGVNDYIFNNVTGKITFAYEIEDGQILQIIYR